MPLPLPPQCHFARPICSYQQDATPRDTPPDVEHQIDGPRVRPLDIIHDEEQWARLRHGLQYPRGLLQQAALLERRVGRHRPLALHERPQVLYPLRFCRSSS